MTKVQFLAGAMYFSLHVVQTGSRINTALYPVDTE
jgi:hypothetical protein